MIFKFFKDNWDYFFALFMAFPVIFILCLLDIKKFELHWVSFNVLMFHILLLPILEEVIFRWGVQDTLANFFNKKVVGLSFANIITAFLFGLAHMRYQPVSWSLSVIPVAIVLGFFYEKKKSLWAPIVLHIFYNGVFFFSMVD